MSAPARRLIVLDRDGVINADSDDYIKSPEEWHPLPGSLEAIARLARAGYDVVVATNQSGLARGLFSAETLDAIHARMREAVAAAGGEIKAIYVCPHRPEDDCRCRKPRPGLLERIARDFGLPLDGVPFIGDKLSDVEAAVAVGARPVLVLTPDGTADAERARALGAEVYLSLARAVDALLAD
ncbi:MAG TPA: D-glycero-beta-D-manno-heptose 1,7-bisphosphate 7-phosphatase [Gammaproteobacteria bacterium]